MLVEIENLYHYSSFKELYKIFDKVAIGYDEDDIADPKDMKNIILQKNNLNMVY